jgi:hypothetical protein
LGFKSLGTGKAADAKWDYDVGGPWVQVSRLHQDQVSEAVPRQPVVVLTVAGKLGRVRRFGRTPQAKNAADSS